MNRLVSFVLALSAVACAQSSDPRPPPMHGETPANVYSCGELTDAGVTALGQGLVVGDRSAGCLTNGLLCPLARLGLALGNCDAGSEAEARCVQNHWQLACVTVDASAAQNDAQNDSPSDHPADAPND